MTQQQSGEHEEQSAKRHSQEIARQPEYENNHNSFSTEMGTLPYSMSLLGNPRLGAQGNTPARSAIMQQMQQTHGNNATRQLVQRSAYSSAYNGGAGLQEGPKTSEAHTKPQLNRVSGGARSEVAVQREEEEGSWMSSVMKAGGSTHAVSEVLEAGEHAHPIFGSAVAGKAASEAAEFSEAGKAAPWLAPLALANGGLEMYEAMNAEHKDASTAAKFTAGGLEAFSGGVGTMGLAGAGLSAAGATGTGGALTAASAAAAPLAALAGAGAAGYSLGSALSEHTRVGEHATDAWGGVDKAFTWAGQGLGLMGPGENRSALASLSDWSSESPLKAAASAPLWALGGLGASVGGLATGAYSGAKEYGGRAVDWLLDR